MKVNGETINGADQGHKRGHAGFRLKPSGGGRGGEGMEGRDRQ